MIGRTFHGNKLREIRQHAGIGTKQLAYEANCHLGHLVRIEGGHSRASQYVSPELAYRLVAALNRLGARVDRRPVTIDDISTADPCPTCGARALAEAATA